jgi:hypothetical protein
LDNLVHGCHDGFNPTGSVACFQTLNFGPTTLKKSKTEPGNFCCSWLDPADEAG